MKRSCLWSLALLVAGFASIAQAELTFQVDGVELPVPPQLTRQWERVLAKEQWRTVTGKTIDKKFRRFVVRRFDVFSTDDGQFVKTTWLVKGKCHTKIVRASKLDDKQKRLLGALFHQPIHTINGRKTADVVFCEFGNGRGGKPNGGEPDPDTGSGPEGSGPDGEGSGPRPEGDPTDGEDPGRPEGSGPDGEDVGPPPEGDPADGGSPDSPEGSGPDGEPIGPPPESDPADGSDPASPEGSGPDGEGVGPPPEGDPNESENTSPQPEGDPLSDGPSASLQRSAASDNAPDEPQGGGTSSQDPTSGDTAGGDEPRGGNIGSEAPTGDAGGDNPRGGDTGSQTPDTGGNDPRGNEPDDTGSEAPTGDTGGNDPRGDDPRGDDTGSETPDTGGNDDPRGDDTGSQTPDTSGSEDPRGGDTAGENGPRGDGDGDGDKGQGPGPVVPVRLIAGEGKTLLLPFANAARHSFHRRLSLADCRPQRDDENDEDEDDKKGEEKPSEDEEEKDNGLRKFGFHVKKFKSEAGSLIFTLDKEFDVCIRARDLPGAFRKLRDRFPRSINQADQSRTSFRFRPSNKACAEDKKPKDDAPTDDGGLTPFQDPLNDGSESIDDTPIPS